MYLCYVAGTIFIGIPDIWNFSCIVIFDVLELFGFPMYQNF